MKSVMGNHVFSQVPETTIERSTFDRSHGLKTTFDSGYLVPIFVDEALPGDTFQVRLTAFARLATPKLPIMDNMKMNFFFFSVPYRLVWDNFKKFMGEQEPETFTEYLIPQISLPHVEEQSLEDYFGLPLFASSSTPLMVNALWHRSYNLIWNEWFRDQNLQDSVHVDKDDGPDDHADYELLKRGKRHDYFTSCLPFPQKGVAVSLPLAGGTVKVRAAGDVPPGEGDGIPRSVLAVDLSRTVQPNGFVSVSPGEAILVTAGSGQNTIFEPGGLYYVEDNAATINSLREAFQLQRLLERDARGGTRYTEILKVHFKVTSPDARLQRPEFLGGGQIPININPVAQTSSSDTQPSPLGYLGATGNASGNVGFTASFTEHCALIGLVCVTADLTYQQGLERMWTRQTKYDHYWPALAHLGEEAVFNQEIFWEPDSLSNPGVFGYQERYASYRYKPSKITGLFRSNATGSLDAWHLSQNFTSLPLLNADFIEENPPIDRVIVVPSEPQFLYDSYIQMRCTRPMPVYGVPGLVDHF